MTGSLSGYASVNLRQNSGKVADLPETVTGVNIRFCFSFIVFCFSFGLRCMLFSAGFLFALCVSRLWLCAVWDSVEKSMLPVFGRPC